jgi:hypothetical protein
LYEAQGLYSTSTSRSRETRGSKLATSSSLLVEVLSRFGVLLKRGSTVATTLSYSTHMYRVNTSILNTTCVQFVNIPHMRTVHTPLQVPFRYLM